MFATGFKIYVWTCKKTWLCLLKLYMYNINAREIPHTLLNLSWQVFWKCVWVHSFTVMSGPFFIELVSSGFCAHCTIFYLNKAVSCNKKVKVCYPRLAGKWHKNANPWWTSTHTTTFSAYLWNPGEIHLGQCLWTFCCYSKHKNMLNNNLLYEIGPKMDWSTGNA